MKVQIAFCAAMSLLAGAARAQCPVSAGVWTGQVGQQRVVFRITNDGTVVDSVAVSFVDACGQAQYSAFDETPVVPLQCNPWGFEWSHCRDNPPSPQGFRVEIRFDGFAHGTAMIDYLSWGCNGGSCLVADFVDVTPVSPGEPPDPVISCQYVGGGTIEYGVSNGGSGVVFDVEYTPVSPVSVDAAPRDLTGPVDAASFPVSCTGAGRGGVALTMRSGGMLIDQCEVCLECAGAGQTPADTACPFGSSPPPVEWSQTYGGTVGDSPASVRQTADGGYGLAGTTGSAFKLIKTDSQSIIQWERTYTVADRTLVLSDMELSEDGGYILAGYVRTAQEPTDFFLLKADAAGDVEWTQTYGDNLLNESARAVSRTSDGGYIVVGNVSFDSPNYDDLFLVKTDAFGSVLWTRIHDAGDIEQPFDVQQTIDGGYVLAGHTTGFGAGSYDSYLVKTNGVGNVEWERAFGGTNADWARSVQQTSDGGFILAGYTNSFGAGDPGDYYLVKTTANGTESWARTYGGPDREEGAVVRETANGGYLLVGSRWTEYQPRAWVGDVFVVRTTWVGDTAWTLSLGGTSTDEGVDVVETGDGGSAILASTFSFGSGDMDFWLVKTGLISGTPTGTFEGPPEVREGFPPALGVALSAFPNPFIARTTLVFMGAEPTRIRLTVHDVAGRLVRVVADVARTTGTQAWTFDASGLASGIYTAALETDRGSAHRKLVLVK